MNLTDEDLVFLILLVIVLFLFGFTGRWDYEEARRVECSGKGLSYDADKDTCYKPTLLKDMV